MTDGSNIKAGDVYYRVYNDPRQGRPHEVTIGSVGPKFVTTTCSRPAKFSKDTLREQYSVLWFSKAAYDEQCEREAAWQNLRKFVMDKYSAPKGIHVQTMRMAQELLNMVTPDMAEPADEIDAPVKKKSDSPAVFDLEKMRSNAEAMVCAHPQYNGKFTHMVAVRVNKTTRTNRGVAFEKGEITIGSPDANDDGTRTLWSFARANLTLVPVNDVENV